MTCCALVLETKQYAYLMDIKQIHVVLKKVFVNTTMADMLDKIAINLLSTKLMQFIFNFVSH